MIAGRSLGGDVHNGQGAGSMLPFGKRIFVIKGEGRQTGDTEGGRGGGRKDRDREEEGTWHAMATNGTGYRHQ